MTPAASRSTATTRPSSRSASLSTAPTPICSMTRLPPLDNALTRPWVVTRNYHRVVTNEPIWWREDVCAENNAHVAIGKESYYLSADGLLMPAKKDQAAPDLRYFKDYAR